MRCLSLFALVLTASACTQPLTIAPSDAATVLAHRSLEAPDPGAPGPLPVRFLYYGSGKDIRRPEYRDSISYRTPTVDASAFARMSPRLARERDAYWGYGNKAFPLNARVWYPAGEGPFPLVLVVHGNHDMKDFSDPGYAWLGEFLASRGYILASIDQNFLNGNLPRDEFDARGWMLLKHLEVFRALNDSIGKPLHRKVDMTRIVLMGHSRGGEAVAIAALFNRLTHYPDDATQRFDFGFDIKGIVSIAGVDNYYKPAGKYLPIENLNYLAFHGSHDGDVASFMAMAAYNRVRYTRPGSEFKSAIWMHRANHGQWNTVWGNTDNGPTSGRALRLDALISGEEQRQFGRVAIGAFLDITLKGRNEYRALFRDHRTAGDWLPPSMYITRYADARTQYLATFEEDVDVTTGSLPGVRISTEGLTTWREGDTPARSRTPTLQSTIATFGWNAVRKEGTPPARVSVHLPDSLRTAWQIGATHALTLSVGTLRASGASDSVPPDLTVEVEDTAGRTARLPLSTFGPVRYPIDSYVYRRRGRDRTQFTTLAETILYTYVAPLSQFAATGTGFDPAQLRTIRLVFDRRPSGSVVVDDVGVGRE